MWAARLFGRPLGAGAVNGTGKEKGHFQGVLPLLLH